MFIALLSKAVVAVEGYLGGGTMHMFEVVKKVGDPSISSNRRREKPLWRLITSL